MLLNTLSVLVFSIISGALLPLAFAPFHLFLLGILCPAILLYLWYAATPKKALWLGWFFGLGFFSTGVYWVYISIHTFGQAPPPLAFLITALFVMLLALFPAIQGYLLKKIFSGKYILWVFPASWVLFEMARTYLFTGFPWLYLGYSQMDSPLRYLAPMFGVYGVSLATAISSSLLTALIIYKKSRTRWIMVLFFILFWFFSWTLQYFQSGISPVGEPLKVSLIQGNIPQSLKWKPEQIKKTVKAYYELTSNHWESDLIVWPEVAIPVTQKEVRGLIKKLSREASDHRTTIMLGMLVNSQRNYYNAILTIGEGKGNYLKRHLVPFGEYFPLRTWLGWLFNQMDIPMSDLTAGKKQQELPSVGGVLFSPSICYEIVYPSLIANDFPKAQMLVTLTDDSWFGDSIAQPQHLQMAQMRALETGRYLLMSTNDGITAVVNFKGKIVKQLPPFKRDVLTEIVQPMQGATPWVKFGLYPMWLFIVLTFGLALIFNYKKNRKK